MRPALLIVVFSSIISMTSDADAELSKLEENVIWCNHIMQRLKKTAENADVLDFFDKMSKEILSDQDNAKEIDNQLFGEAFVVGLDNPKAFDDAVKSCISMEKKFSSFGGQKAPDITGTYNVTGTNPNGSRYRGTCVITQIAENSYSFQWNVGQAYRGKGVRKGDTVTVEWGAPYPVIYKVQSDGSLQGVWHNGRATERLSR